MRSKCRSDIRRAIPLLFLGVALLFPFSGFSQTSLDTSPLSVPSLIAPAYFGPNAFPVPEVLSADTLNSIEISTSASADFGYMSDKTYTLNAKAMIPLFTNRVVLVVSMPVQEWYFNSLERQRFCRLQDTTEIRGHGAGDVFVSTNILILKERKYVPAIAVRAALRTASGGQYQYARFYDSPGYFFDAAIAKAFSFKKDINLRFSASAGFLCWQTDNARQNDAVMYGILLQLKTKYIRWKTEFAGYAGWEKQGDLPMVIRTKIEGLLRVRGKKHNDKEIHSLNPFVKYGYGIKDSPWHHLEVGITYSVEVVKKK